MPSPSSCGRSEVPVNASPGEVTGAALTIARAVPVPPLAGAVVATAATTSTGTGVAPPGEVGAAATVLAFVGELGRMPTDEGVIHGGFGYVAVGFVGLDGEGCWL